MHQGDRTKLKPTKIQRNEVNLLYDYHGDARLRRIRKEASTDLNYKRNGDAIVSNIKI
jgi:hypothetical protein